MSVRLNVVVNLQEYLLVNRTFFFILLAITMKIFCNITKANVVILVRLKHHRMVILSLCTCFA